MREITFLPFAEEDIDVLTLIMKRSFDENTRIHLGRKEGNL